jgi:hypothetical protein
MECGMTLYHLFVDFKSAYDTVNRAVILSNEGIINSGQAH